MGQYSLTIYYVNEPMQKCFFFFFFEKIYKMIFLSLMEFQLWALLSPLVPGVAYLLHGSILVPRLFQVVTA